MPDNSLRVVARMVARSEGVEEVRSILDDRTEQWGVEITAVELKDIVLPHEMKRAMDVFRQVLTGAAN